MDTLTLYIPEGYKLTEDQLLAVCERNDHLRIETDSEQNLIIMTPTGYDTGKYNSELLAELVIWNRQKKNGVVFDSSTGFKLPDGSVKSPDVSWLPNSKAASLSEEERKGFAPVCPDFVVELRPHTDSLSPLKEKMQQYISNGCRLAWLLDPENRLAYIYRPDAQEEHMPITSDTALSGEDILPGFVLNPAQLFDAENK